jgi:hypothetical protein
MDTWILEMVRVRCKRRIAACAIILAAVALFGAYQQRYVRNFLLGPYDLGGAELDAIGEVTAAPEYFARVTGVKVIDTEIQEFTINERNGVETSRSVSAGYYALDMGDRFLICKSASGPSTNYTGALAPLPAGFTAQFFDTPEMQALRDRFYPYYLDDESFRLPGYIAIALFLILAFFLVKISHSARKHLKDPSSHPVCQRVQQWGDSLGISFAAQREADTPRFKGRNGWVITEQFLVRSTFFSFNLLRISDLLWAYKKVTKHSVNFIPTGKTYESILYCHGGEVTIRSKEKITDAILEFLSQRTPWAFLGFSQELEEHFKKNRAAFCEAVEQSRQELTRQGRQAPTAG